MSWKRPLAACALAIGALGCESTDRDLKPSGPLNASHREVNAAMVEGFTLGSLDAAVVRQHTLYPYHFRANSAALNELGEREAYILATHYQQHPGPLNVRRGEADEPLYDLRVKTVRDAMARAGIAADRIEISDGLPGGDGIASERVLMIQDRERSQQRASDQGDRDTNRDANRGRDSAGDSSGDSTGSNETLDGGGQ